MSDADAEALDPAVGKVGRDEAIKLRAAWLNTVSVALFVAALVQPVLGYVQRPRTLSLVEWIASAIFLIASIALFVAAQAVVKRLED